MDCSPYGCTLVTLDLPQFPQLAHCKRSVRHSNAKNVGSLGYRSTAIKEPIENAPLIPAANGLLWHDESLLLRSKGPPFYLLPLKHSFTYIKLLVSTGIVRFHLHIIAHRVKITPIMVSNGNKLVVCWRNGYMSGLAPLVQRHRLRAKSEIQRRTRT
jgi:hypothetical protein